MIAPPQSRILSPRNLLILAPTGIAVIAAIAVLVVLRPRPPCAGIFEQTAPRLQGQLEIIEAKGGFAVGHEQIQELTEGAQKVGLHLKTCCTVLEGGRLDPATFQGCIARAADYERQVAAVAEQVDAAAATGERGVPELAEEEVTAIRTKVRQAIQEVARLERQVSQIGPRPRGGGAQERAAPPGAEAEPNDSILEANRLAVGRPTDGEITATDDHDFYRFDYEGALRDSLTIRLENRSATLRPWFKLYDRNKSETRNHYDPTPGANLELALAAEPDTAWYLQVLPYDTTGAYRLSVLPQQAYDSLEPNDTPFEATPIRVGEAIEAGIMDPADTDWYALAPPGRDSITVRLENRSQTLRPWLKVYDRNKAELASPYNGTPGADLEHSFEADPDARYYLRVMPYDSRGTYRLSVR